LRQARPIDAGPACLAAICRIYGARVGVGRIRELANASRSGATLSGLQRAAEALGYETVATTATERQLASNTPAIAATANGRWVVVTAVGRRRVRIADPVQAASARISRAAFASTWTGEALFLRPTEAIDDLEPDPPALARIAPYLGALKTVVGELLLASLLIQVLSFALPAFARFVVDEMIARRDERWLTASLEAMAAVLTAFLVVSFARRQLLDFISRQIEFCQSLPDRLVMRLQRLDDEMR